MNDTDLLALVRRQRAHRAFSPEPVTDDDIAALLEIATYAPSAENRQPWEFVVVRDAAQRDAIGALMRRAWETRGRAFSETRLDPKMLTEVEQGALGGVADAPVLILVCADIERGLEQTVPSSVFPAIQNLLLAATARDLGSALTTIAAGYRSELARQFSLPDTVVPVAVIPVGHPARPLGAARRDPFATHAHREHYGTPWE